MTHHFRGISLALAENVFIGKKSTEITSDTTACQPIDRLTKPMSQMEQMNPSQKCSLVNLLLRV
jgi:hypothetical protein